MIRLYTVVIPLFISQQLRRDMDQLDTWLNYREGILSSAGLGDSIDAVEELIRKHDDFEKTVEAQEEKFNAIKRLTLVGWMRCRSFKMLPTKDVAVL